MGSIEPMLFDMIGALIGFAAVMLLMSLLVTALVQATQHVFHLRERNLRWGLARLLEPVAARSLTEIGEKKPPGKVLVEHVLGGANPLHVAGGSRLAKLLGQTTTWIEAGEFRAALGAFGETSGAGKVPKDLVDETCSRFERLEPRLSAKFACQIRWVTIVWAAVLACVFQLSTPELLSRLSTDAEVRARYVEMGESLVSSAEARVARSSRDGDVSEQALDALAEAHPDLSERLEEASGIGDDRSSVLDELRLVLQEVENGEEIVAEYDLLLERLSKECLEQALQDARTAGAQLAMLDLRLWPGGWGFYLGGAKAIDNWCGVLITVMLLSFGAPFWFYVLKNLVGLRDMLTPTKEKTQ